jgi:predicted dehydrogenase
VEKPIAASLAEADQLIDAARAGGLVLAVGHVEFHNPAVQALLAQGAPARFVEVQRLGVWTPRSLDVDVILDLMIHDLQILHALEASPLTEVRATGIAVLSPKVDICNARLVFASGLVANLTASRVSAERVRKLRVFQPASYVSVDYMTKEVKGLRLVDELGARRITPLDLPVADVEPLRHELLSFVAACRGEASRVVSGVEGRQALATALAVAAEAERTSLTVPAPRA